MKKRILLTVVMMMLMFALVGCGNSNKNVTTLIMADVQEGDHPTALACDKFAELVKQKTNGRINIEKFRRSC